MFLSDGTIRRYIERGFLKVKPLEDLEINQTDLVVDDYTPKISAASLDLRISNEFRSPQDFDVERIQLDKKYELPPRIADELITVEPNSYILARTVETVDLPNDVSAIALTRSSVFRKGASIVGSWVDAGYQGTLTVKVYNDNPIPLDIPVNYRMIQVIFCKQDHPSEVPYGGKYQGQTSNFDSKGHLDEDHKINQKAIDDYL